MGILTLLRELVVDAYLASAAQATPTPGMMSNFNAPSISPRPNYDLFSMTDTSSLTPQPVFATPSVTEQIQTQPSKLQPNLDAFGSLSSLNPRQASPLQYHDSIQPVLSSKSPLEPKRSSHQNMTQLAPSTVLQNNGGGAEEEWTFSSSLPDNSREITVTNTSILVKFHVKSGSVDESILISSGISNNTSQPVSNLTFQLAVMKVELRNT